MPNKPRRLILVLSGGRALLERAGIVEPVDLTPPGLAAFRVHVWNSIKDIRPGGSIEVLLNEFRTASGFPSGYVDQCASEYRQRGF